MADCGAVLREVRLGIVMNGGVSLAVWIGGVTHEIDCMRRAHGASDEAVATEPTTAVYRELLTALHQRVLVDVVSGASAGGINGALLASAVYAETHLPPLRDVWLTVGDFSKLLRSPSKREPPSLLRGDEYVLPELEQRFREILSKARTGPKDQPVHLYVTGTDFYGVERVFTDSMGRRFQELEHRRVFQFQHPAPGRPGAEEMAAVAAAEEAASGGGPCVMPPVATFDRPDAAELLAAAARSSSSFPVAFEAHGLRFEGEKTQRWLIDGGVLDNQPFNPVLNRIATVAVGDQPVKRVVGFVVPYVTEPGAAAPADRGGAEAAKEDGPARPTAKQTSDAARALPRDVPKLTSLTRIVWELGEGRRNAQARTRLDDLHPNNLEHAAQALFRVYRKTRYAESLETFAHWALRGFRPGAGEIGQLETLDPREALEAPVPFELPQDDSKSPPAGLPWVPDHREWLAETGWHWGLAPSERIAAETLLRLRKLLLASPEDQKIKEAKGFASDLVAAIRAKKFLVCQYFHDQTRGDDLVQRAEKAYIRVIGSEFSKSFRKLAELLSEIDQASLLQKIIDAEIVENAFRVERVAVAPVFDFLHMSAGVRNSLGHPESSPMRKLAGMKLGHFAGFLKSSWRANDWLWGRLDGVEYLVAAVLDLDYLKTLAPPLDEELSELAFPADLRGVLKDPWRQTLSYARTRRWPEDVDYKRVAEIVEAVSNVDPRAEFSALLDRAADETLPSNVRARLLDCCRAALAARIQLEILEEELPEVARAIDRDLELGASRGSSGAEWIAHPTGETAHERLERFKSLSIGRDELPVEEASSKLGMDVGSTAAAVAAAAFSGSRGGLPAAVRAPLATLRGLTLVFSIIVRLLVRTPVLGFAAMIAAAVALVWGLVAPNTLLGAALPGLAAVVIGGAAVLIATVTSPLESPCRGIGQKLGLVVIFAAPALLVAGVGLPFGLRDRYEGLGVVSGWLLHNTGAVAFDLAVCAALAAVLAALLRIVLGRTSRNLRVIDLWIYRWCYLIAGASLAVGATIQHAGDKTCESGQSSWSCVADNWHGTILFLILLGAISLAPLVAELAAGGRWLAQRKIPPLGPEAVVDAVVEAFVILMVLGLMMVTAFLGWVIGHYAI